MQPGLEKELKVFPLWIACPFQLEVPSQIEIRKGKTQDGKEVVLFVNWQKEKFRSVNAKIFDGLKTLPDGFEPILDELK